MKDTIKQTIIYMIALFLLVSTGAVYAQNRMGENVPVQPQQSAPQQPAAPQQQQPAPQQPAAPRQQPAAPRQQPAAPAVNVTSQGLEYRIVNNNVEITRYNGNAATVEIPAQIQGLPVTIIGARAFYGNQSITSVTIPRSVTTIRDNAFSNTNLVSVTFLGIVNSISNTYDMSSGTSSYPFPGGGFSVLYPFRGPGTYIRSGNSWDGPYAINSVSSSVPQGLEYSIEGQNVTITGYTGSATTLEIPAQIQGLPVTSIMEKAFMYCRTLNNITIPNSVTSIGDFAFAYCASLTSITIPNSVTSIGDFAFSGCYNLTGVTLSNSVTNIGDYTFVQCINLIRVDIPDSVTSIGAWVFMYCTSLTSITIPDSVASIGAFAFMYCTSLTSIIIPNSVTNIRSGTFTGCTNLTRITIPDSVISIEDSFSGCTSLTAIDVSAGNSAYSSNAGVLYNKDKTFLIKYPASKTEASFIIPNSVTNIGDNAFLNCTSLTSIIIPNSVTSIGDSAFFGCASLVVIDVSAGNSAYSSDAGVLYNREKTFLIHYPASKTEKSFTIPNSVTSIGNFAFSGCTNLTRVIIPDSVISIGDYAFFNCTNLTSITFEDSIGNDNINIFIDFGDLYIKYRDGGPGTYTRESDGKIWTKQQ